MEKISNIIDKLKAHSKKKTEKTLLALKGAWVFLLLIIITFEVLIAVFVQLSHDRMS